LNSTREQTLNIDNYEAVILDLDGVITRTAALHAKAWEIMFKDFLDTWMNDNNEQVEQFDIEQDYPEYIDGKPRYDGVRSFLDSRDIDLPEGSPDDSPDKQTICGLGNRKNELFHEQMEKEGVHVYDDTIDQIKQWKQKGLKIGVISASKNCKDILEVAEILELFDTRVDGVIAEEQNLDGKPAPDVFIQAAKNLDTQPEKAVIVEDALAGIQAGKEGEFGFLIGIARNIDADSLYNAGADLVVQTLGDLKSSNGKLSTPESLPNALEYFQDITKDSGEREFAIFLDYDGTLTPIVQRPEDAKLSSEMQSVLQQLAKKFTVGIISGRDRQAVQDFVQLEELIYAGSHGFDIQGPNGLEMKHEQGKAALPSLDEAEKNLQSALVDIEGAQIERKRFAIAVHYRNVSDQDSIDQLRKICDNEIEKHDHLKAGYGKKIIELKPDIDWDKGKALLWLLDALDLNPEQVIPIYIGDDLTDEDAFRELVDRGIGILVGAHGEKTAARYQLSDVDEVEKYLKQLISLGEEQSE